MAFELVGKLQLIDQMTAPLKNATSAVGILGKTAGKSSAGLGQFTASGKAASVMGGGFNASMSGMISTMGKVASAIGVTKLALDTIHKSMDFESSIAGVASISPEAKKAKDSLADFAMEASVGTKFGATEAADGIGELVRAGRSVEQVMGGDLKAAMAMAAADDMSLAEACVMVSDNMNMFSKEGLTAAQAADTLAGASAASSTDIKGIQQGLTMVGSVASAAGMSLKDTTTALGLMANAGIKGSDAGTAMKTMLGALTPSSKAAKKQMQKLGLITKKGGNQFFDAAGNMKSLADISQLLTDSMKDLTPEQRSVAMETMFGTDAVRAANVMFENGAKGVTNFQTAMGQTTALQMAADKLDSASGAADILNGILSTLQIVLGEALLPVIKDFCTWAANAATNIVAWFNSTEGQTTLQTLTDTIYKVIDGIKSFCSWLGDQLSPLFASIKTDIDNVVTALTAWLKSDDAAAWFDAIKGAAEGVIEKITAVYNFFSDNFKTIGPIIAGVVAGIWAFNAATAIMGVVAGIQAAGGLAAAATAAWGFAAALLANPATWIALAIGALIAAVILLWQNWDQVSAWLSASWDVISAKATEIFNGIATFFTNIWNSISTAATTAWTNFSTTIQGLWQNVSNFFGGITLADVGMAIVNTLLAGFTGGWSLIISGLSGLWSQVSGFFGGCDLSTIGGNIISGLWNGLKATWANVTKWFNDMVNSIPQWVRDALGIHSPSRVMMELGEYTMLGFVKGMDNEQSGVERSAVSLADTPVQAVTTAARSVPDAAPAPATAAPAPTATKQISFTFGNVILHGVSGDLESAADRFMEIIAERLQTEGGMVAEGVE
jgi:TP901 family phage tail tape measure protein